MQINSGIILPNNEIININGYEIINYLYNEIENGSIEDKNAYRIFKNLKINNYDEIIIEFFVSLKNYVVIYKNNVYYQENCNCLLSDFVQRGYYLRELQPRFIENNVITIKKRFENDNKSIKRIKKNKSI